MFSFPKRTAYLLAFCSVGSCLVGVALGNSVPSQAKLQAAPTTASVNPQEKVLYANLYMQTSAEYRAVCTQTYALATEKLRTRLASIPVEETRKPAVIMDLDETVLDNSGYQSFLDRERSAKFLPATWTEWEKNHANEVGLVPAAKDFIEFAERNGVTVVYISNRSTTTQDGTIAALKANGINTADIASRILLQAPSTPSNKTDRRNKAILQYRVVMLFGDNLRDFSEEFVAPKLDGDNDVAQKAAIADRKAKVDATRNHWGVDWFILPNPVYGEWEKLLGNNPRLKMRSTTMPMTK